jgi:nucleoside-diphosphate-sugar epimerase
MTSRVLITGCNGLLGTSITKRLNQRGFYTIGLTKDEKTPSLCGETFYGSASDKELVSNVMQEIDIVVHLAAIRTPRFDPPAEIFEKNSLSTFQVLSTAAEKGARTLIHASSISTLGFSFAETRLIPPYLPIDDKYPCRVSDAYGLSKVVDEQTVKYIRNRFKTNIYAIRFPYIGDSKLLLPERSRQIAANSNFGSNDFWSYLDINDAVFAIETLIDEIPMLSDPVLTVVAPNTLAKTPTEYLLNKHFPQLSDRPVFMDFESVFEPSVLLGRTSFQFKNLFPNG